MKKIFLTLAVLVMAICASAQKNQYFWYQGNLMLGNPIAQIDSVTFGTEDTDSILLYLPRTIIKTIEVHDTVYITIHDTVCPNAIPEGALNGVFSVSADKKVRFSKGNLQYQASTDTWRFAENQWDYIGENNENISSTYDGWIDLFGWGTGDNPTKVNGDYSTFTDWGTNVIDGIEGPWYTMDKDEWEYLHSGRNNASNLMTKGTVNNTYGLIILPDNWNSSTSILSIDTVSYESNIITAEEWQFMENQGVIFLPVTRWRSGSWIPSNSINNGTYFTSSPYGDNSCYEFSFGPFHSPSFVLVQPSEYGRSIGHAVRLVQDVTE